MRQIILIAHNLRSTHNVGSLLRTAEGLGLAKVWLTGYTAYPKLQNDNRLPHIAQKLDKQIAKTALGAEKSLNWGQADDIFEVIKNLKRQNYSIVALEQSAASLDITKYTPPDKIALIIGREVEGIEEEVLDCAQQVLEIPMFGQKESFNVVQAAAMALFRLRFA